MWLATEPIEEFMNHGLSSEDLAVIRQCFGSDSNKVWLFGSRARGDYKRYSDIDLLMDPDHEITSSRLSEIREALEESSLPFKVDLVRASELAEPYRNGVFRDRVKLF